MSAPPLAQTIQAAVNAMDAVFLGLGARCMDGPLGPDSVPPEARPWLQRLSHSLFDLAPWAFQLTLDMEQPPGRPGEFQELHGSDRAAQLTREQADAPEGGLVGVPDTASYRLEAGFGLMHRLELLVGDYYRAPEGPQWWLIGWYRDRSDLVLLLARYRATTYAVEVNRDFPTPSDGPEPGGAQ